MKILGIDIGGTSIKYSDYSLNENNQIDLIKEVKIMPTPRDGQDLINKVIELINDQNPDLVGISTAGAVNFKTGEVFSIPNIKNYQGTIWKKVIKERTGKIAYIDNDVNCAVFAEYKKGSLQNTTNSIMLTLGTGIGAGIIINNDLYRGSNYAAGEVGWQLINGHFYEKIASTLSVINQSKHLGIMSGFSLLDKNNEKAVSITKEWYKNIAIGILNIVAVLDVDTVCLGGGVIGNKNFDTQQILKHVLEMGIINVTNPDLKIVKATFENQAGSFGAALLAYHSYKKEYLK